MCQRRNWKENCKILWDEWKQNYNKPNFMGCSKSSDTEKCITVNVCIEKEERFQISNLTYFKELKENLNPK